MRATFFIVSLTSQASGLRMGVRRATTKPRWTGHFMSRSYETTLSFMVMPTRRTLSCPSRIPQGIPRIHNLDFHIEGVSTEQAGLFNNQGNHGLFNYWNTAYHDGNTNGANLIGNAVGREGRTIQCWLRYWISPRNTLQFIYKHNTVSSDFVP